MIGMLLSGAFAPCVGLGDYGGPRVSSAVRYYQVQGSSAEQLLAELKAKGIPAPGGKVFFGHTEWQVHWTFHFKSEGNSCRMQDVDVTAKVDQKLPEWSPAPGAPASLVSDWQRFITALRQHEDGHRDLGVQAATQIYAALKALRAGPDCDGISRRANEAGQSVLAETRRREAQYDHDSDHGKSQGVRFP